MKQEGSCLIDVLTIWIVNNITADIQQTLTANDFLVLHSYIGTFIKFSLQQKYIQYIIISSCQHESLLVTCPIHLQRQYQ